MKSTCGDDWPTFKLSPAEYERTVTELIRTKGHEVVDWQVTHLDSIDGVDGTYVIDVTARFRLLGADFLLLVECKRHTSPVKREDVQVLHDKLRSTGAQKGMVVAASGFQRGALEYARTHGIACVRLLDDAWVYETRSQQPEVRPSGHYAAFIIEPTETGYERTLLAEGDNSALFEAPPT